MQRREGGGLLEGLHLRLLDRPQQDRRTPHRQHDGRMRRLAHRHLAGPSPLLLSRQARGRTQPAVYLRTSPERRGDAQGRQDQRVARRQAVRLLVRSAGSASLHVERSRGKEGEAAGMAVSDRRRDAAGGHALRGRRDGRTRMGRRRHHQAHRRTRRPLGPSRRIRLDEGAELHQHTRS